jgi:hypothetical protein
MEGTLIAHCGAHKIGRDELRNLPIPPATGTFKPIPHHEVVEVLIETLGFRHIGIVRDEYAATADGNKMFGVMDLEAGFTGCRFSVGLRNSHDKTMRLALVIGRRTVVCDNLAFYGDFQPVLAKHSKKFSLVDAVAIGVDRMQRNFEPMREQVERWRATQITDEQAKLVIYRAFIEGDAELPRHLARAVHDEYFNPTLPEFTQRTTWSLENAFTTTLKTLDPIPFFKATAKLGSFLHRN